MKQDKAATSGASRVQPPQPTGEGGATGRAIVVVPVISRPARDGRGEHRRAPQARHEEALGLARAIDLDIVHSEIVNVADPRPATLIGSGKLAELATLAKEQGAELAVFDHPLSPVQQRNLEKELNAKVLDRTGLILEIFGRRARTKEGTLQVDLAHLEYQRGRLVRSWTHLERQRGGAGFLGGPGETQIEADRRLLQEKILRLKRELETVRRTRDLHRAKRRKVPYPVVAVVGFKYAGKSTLFNRLTGASVLAEDMLFATLDPTLRRLKLPLGTEIILSDTVGFISDLPTHLIAAFRATLEEVVEADLVIHLRDISDPDTHAQADDVGKILADLDVDIADAERVIEVWNKVDLLDETGRQHVLDSVMKDSSTPPIAISAGTGEGIGDLVGLIESKLSGLSLTTEAHLAASELHLIDWLYRSGTVARGSRGWRRRSGNPHHRAAGGRDSDAACKLARRLSFPLGRHRP